MLEFIAGLNTTWLDFTGTFLTMIGLAFYVLNMKTAWHFSNAGLLPYTLLFFATAMWPLFWLQVLFIAFGIHGYVLWYLMDKGSKYTEMWRLLTLPMAAACAIVAGIYTDYASAWAIVQYGIVLFSVVASYGLAQRYAWSWLVWLPANVLGFFYYAHTELVFLMWAQIPLFIFSVVGYYQWTYGRVSKRGLVVEPMYER